MSATMLKPGEAALRLDVSTQTLRDWERAGLLSPTRTEGGHRRFPLDQIERVKDRRRTKASEDSTLLMRATLALLPKSAPSALAVLDAAELWRDVVAVDNLGGGDYIRTLEDGHAADAKRVRLAAAIDAYREAKS